MSVGSTLVRGAEIRFQEAAEKLRPFVGCFWVITADRDAVLQLVPDGSTTISAQLQDGGVPAWSLRGPLLKPDARRFAAPATVVGIRLRPGVAYILTGIAMDTLVDRRIDLTSIEAVPGSRRRRASSAHTRGAHRVARAVSDRAAGACRHSPGRGVCPRRARAQARRSAGVRAGRPQRRQPSAAESPDAPVGRLRLQAPRDHRPLPGDASRDGAVGPASSGFPGDGERVFRPVSPDARHRPVLRSHARRPRAARDDRFFQDPLRRASLEYRPRLVRSCHGWAGQSTSMLRSLYRWESRFSAWSSD